MKNKAKLFLCALLIGLFGGYISLFSKRLTPPIQLIIGGSALTLGTWIINKYSPKPAPQADIKNSPYQFREKRLENDLWVEQIEYNGKVLSRLEFVRHLSRPAFQKFFGQRITEIGTALFDSTKLSRESMHQPFYFRFNRTWAFSIRWPNPKPFFKGRTKKIIERDITHNRSASIFPSVTKIKGTNISARDLIIPTPSPERIKTGKKYLSIWHFVTYAPQDEVEHFWNLCARKIMERLQNGIPTYFSFHGLSVNWLHGRLSTVPDSYSVFGDL